jgi:hypothetical protein
MVMHRAVNSPDIGSNPVLGAKITNSSKDGGPNV